MSLTKLNRLSIIRGYQCLNFDMIREKLTSHNNNHIIKLYLLLLFIAYPLRESFAFTMGASPIRMGELIVGFSPLILLSLPNKSNRNWSTRGNLLILFFIYILVVSTLSSSLFDSAFAFKYIIRAFLFISFIKIAETKTIYVTPYFFDRLLKYTLLIQIPFCILQFVGYDFLFMSIVPYDGAPFAGIIRCNGTASEPGYLVPILASCLFYFINTRRENKKWLYLTLLVLFLCFSSFSIIMVPLFLWFVLRENPQKKKTRLFLRTIVFVSICLIVVVFFVPEFLLFIQAVQTKVIAFISGNTDNMDYSAAERTENIQVAISSIKKMNWLNLFLGYGLGACGIITRNNVVTFLPGEEAYNLYFSNILNIGIVGSCIIYIFFYKVIRYSNDDLFSKSFKFAIVVQLIQYFILGNIWLYFLWFDLFFLIIIKKNRNIFVR